MLFFLTYLPGTLSLLISSWSGYFQACVSLSVLNKIKTGPKISSFNGPCIAATTLVLSGRQPNSAQKLTSREAGTGLRVLGGAPPAGYNLSLAKESAEQRNLLVLRRKVTKKT